MSRPPARALAVALAAAHACALLAVCPPAPDGTRDPGVHHGHHSQTAHHARAARRASRAPEYRAKCSCGCDDPPGAPQTAARLPWGIASAAPEPLAAAPPCAAPPASQLARVAPVLGIDPVPI